MSNTIQWEYPVCNFCQSSYYDIVFDQVTTWEHAGVFRVVRCSACALTYLNPRPDISSIGGFYPSQTYWGKSVTASVALDSDWRKKREEDYSFLYQRIFSYKNSGSIYDIGAGTGVFLSKFQEEGWIVAGNELSADAVGFARKIYRVRLKVGDLIPSKNSRKKYDVVTLNNALEHLYNPTETLHAVRHLMEDDGIVVITVPNQGSLGWKLFSKNWYALQPPRHLYHFSESTLKMTLAKTGFTPLSISYGYWTHNYATLFESMRILLSPKFKKASRGGIASHTNPTLPSSFSLKKELAKYCIQSIAACLAIIGSLLHVSEVITVVAKKSD